MEVPRRAWWMDGKAAVSRRMIWSAQEGCGNARQWWYFEEGLNNDFKVLMIWSIGSYIVNSTRNKDKKVDSLTWLYMMIGIFTCWYCDRMIGKIISISLLLKHACVQHICISLCLCVCLWTCARVCGRKSSTLGDVPHEQSSLLFLI